MNPMLGRDVTAARVTLGQRWGFKRPAKKSELARALAVSEQSVANWEAGRMPCVGPVRVLLHLYLQGLLPPDDLSDIRTHRP